MGLVRCTPDIAKDEMSDAKPWDTLSNKPPAPLPRTGIFARLLAWTRKHWLITTLLVLYGLSHVWHWMLTPTINPHPQELVTIKGTFPFDQGYEMNVYMGARTTTKWVNEWHGFPIPGRSIGYDSEVLPITIIQIDSKNYEFSFYRDFYLPGIAGWRLSGLMMKMPKKGAAKSSMLVAFPRFHTALKCVESKRIASKPLICTPLNGKNTDIYAPSTRNSKVDFYLESEVPDDLTTIDRLENKKGD